MVPSRGAGSFADVSPHWLALNMDGGHRGWFEGLVVVVEDALSCIAILGPMTAVRSRRKPRATSEGSRSSRAAIALETTHVAVELHAYFMVLDPSVLTPRPS